MAVETLKLVFEVLTKLGKIAIKVNEAKERAEEGELMFIDLQQRIAEAKGILTILYELGADHAMLSEPAMQGTLIGLQGHIDVATFHVTKWSKYGNNWWGRAKKYIGSGKETMESMGKVHVRLHEVSVVVRVCRRPLFSRSNECVRQHFVCIDSS
jgi:hypothetical protein